MSGTTDDTTTQTPPPDYLAQAIALAQKLAPPSAMPSGTPDDGTKPSWTGLLGRALSGGQAPGYQLRGSQADTSGNRALLNFGINMLLASGPHASRPDLLSAAATGLQGAQQSLGQDQQRAAQLAAAQQAYGQQQFQNRIAALKEALPLIRMGTPIPNALTPGSTTGAAGAPGAPGATPTPAATAPPGAYGQGGPNTAKVPDEYMPYYQEASARTGIPVDVLMAKDRQESGFNPNAVGKSGEIGISQVMPSTALAPGYGMKPLGTDADAVKTALKDPRTAINFGADYLKARLRGDPTDPAVIRQGLFAYNGGGDKNYVANVTRYMPAPAPPAAVGSAGPSAAPPGATPSGPSPVASVAPPGATPATRFAGPGVPPAAPPSVVAPAQPGTAPIAAPGGPAAPTAGQTFEDFRAQHPIAVDPASYAVTPPDLANAKAAQMEAARQLTLSRQGLGGDPNKSLSDYNTATQNVAKLQQEAQTKSLELRQAAEKNALDTQRQLYDQEMTRQQQAQLKAQELAQQAAENEKNRSADIRKTELTAGYTAQQKQADADIDIAKNDLTERTAETQKAARVIPILQQMQGQLGKLPDGVIGTLLGKYDTTGDITGILAKMGVVDPDKATAAQMLIAARNYLSIEMKPAATGSLRVAEMDKLQSFTPGQLQTTEAQQEMAARLIAYQKRIQDERSFASNYFGRPSDPSNPNSQRIYDNRGLDAAMNAPVKYDQNGVVTGGGLGPVVPEPPPVSASDAEHQAYLNYINRNLAAGAPYQTWEPKKNGKGGIALDQHGQIVPERVTKLKVPQ